MAAQLDGATRRERRANMALTRSDHARRAEQPSRASSGAGSLGAPTSLLVPTMAKSASSGSLASSVGDDDLSQRPSLSLNPTSAAASSSSSSAAENELRERLAATEALLAEAEAKAAAAAKENGTLSTALVQHAPFAT